MNNAPTRPSERAGLAEWLSFMEAIHPDEIDMGLDRAREVAVRAELLPVSVPIITVAGTNGKGSTVAMLEAIYCAAGYRTGVYTSPHIVHFNERVAVAGQAVTDEVLVNAFEVIERARDITELTYFEFATLAAVRVFVQQRCDVIILEVGLGGRLDTTNLWDTSCAIVTSIALDHESWLGSDRTQIGHEKIGIGRAGVPLIMGDQEPPEAVLKSAQKAGMQVQQVPPASARETLSLSLPGDHQQANAYAALHAVAHLYSAFPITLGDARRALASVTVPGRFEHHRRDGINVVLDVAHNPAAASSVASALDERFPGSPVYAVFGALNDKDVAGVVAALAHRVQHWHCITLPGDRGTQAQQLSADIRQAGGEASAHDDMVQAWSAACEQANAYNSNHPLPEATVLVAGSFFTLTALHDHWQNVGRTAN